MTDPLASPPIAPQQPHEHAEHGLIRPDPYYWMHDASSPEFLAYVTAERRFYDATCAHLTPLVTALQSEMVARLSPAERSVKWHRMGFSYYTQHRTGSDYAELLREKHLPAGKSATNLGSDSPETGGNVTSLVVQTTRESVLDFGTLLNDSGYLDIGLTIVSPDENWLAYSADTTGDEVFTMRFRDLRTGNDHDEIARTYYGGAWSADSAYFFYTVHDDTYRPHQIWRHRIGTAASKDVLVLSEPDERFELNLRGTRSGDAIIVWSESNSTSEAWFLDARTPLGPPRSIGGRRPDIRYRAEHQRLANGLGQLLIVTNDRATEFRLMIAPVPAEADQDWTAWTELVPENPRERLIRADAFAAATVLTLRVDGTTALRISPSQRTLTSGYPAGEIALDRNTDYDATEITIRDESWLFPATWSAVDLVTGQRRELLRHRTPNHDPARYLTERRTFVSADATAVPATILRHRDTPLDGTAPCLIYGYGAYEAVFEPEWDPALPSLLDRGVVYAYAHVRGGGEGGRQWYLDGKLAAKQHTFDDHVAVADGLVAGGLVDPSRIATRGLSAGGLLQAAVFSQRPDRWCAVLAEVPFVDVVTTMFDANTPLTATEWEEWGDPRIVEEFQWMSAYDPMQNLPAAGARPDLLVTGAVHDPRVLIREPAKWVAALRASDPAWSPRCLFRPETGAGAHVGPSGRFGHLAYEAEVLAWLLDRLGLSW
ncbi:MAG: prolyl oligopeptidase family serine peptidase [Nocardioides sp.]